ncbi:MAG: TIGR02147 family protein [Sandaracinaceae bacterium]
MKPAVPHVFRYLDARAFLGDYYAAKKAERRAFSFRAFSRRAGLKSPNHLKRVIDGDRNLSEETAVVYARVIGLTGDASEYFCELVRFTQAKGAEAKRTSYRNLVRFRGYRRAQRIDVQHHRYHAHWYIPAIRELVAHPGFRADPGWIAQRLLPPIREAQAARALVVLQDLGMIEVHEDGTAAQKNAIVSTGAQTAGLHIADYHRAMMEKAAEAMDNVPARRREMSGVTFSIREDMVDTVKERIAAFRRELIALEADADEVEQVVHVAIQLFPLTQEPNS